MIVTQTPTFPNGTQSDMIYVVSGSFFQYAQHRYICRVQSGSETLSSIKQVGNLDGMGVFEVSRLLDDHMTYESPWLTTGSTPIVNSPGKNINQFTMSFAEEYGTSLTSSIVTTGYTVASGSGTVIPAVVERDAGYFNWPSSSYDALTNAPHGFDTIDDSSRANALVVSGSDFATLSSLSGIAPKGAVTSVFIDVYDILNPLGTSIHTEQLTNPFGTVDLEDQLIHVGVGPANLADVPGLQTYLNDPEQYPYYSVQFRYFEGGEGTAGSKFYLYNNKSNCYKGTNFAFINKLGVYDYYRATLVDTQNEKFERETYKAPYINYSTKSTTVSYDAARRGDTQYYASFENSYTAETDWLTQEQADYLFELFESPSVYVQRGDKMLGCVITNASEAYKTNPKGQKIFKFTIQYRLSNSKHSRY